MGDGIQYDVSAVLKVGQASAFVSDMGKAASAADDLQTSLDRMSMGAHKMGAGLLDIGSRAVAMAAKVTAVGTAVAAAGVGAATAAIGKNYSLLEDKSIQLSAVIAAATSQPFDKARIESEKLFAEFKVDAISSAGETKNFVETAALIAGPILGAGESMKKLHDITKGVIDIAPAMAVKFDQAAGDISKILQGSAGADLPLFQAMKAIPALAIPAAEAFNKLDPKKRLELVTKAIENPAFKAAAAMAGNSFTGLISTSQDLLKTMGGLALSPTFGRVKNALGQLTAGTIEQLKPGAALDRSLRYFGNTLAVRFDQTTGALQRLFPKLDGTVVGLIDTLDNLANRGFSRLITGITFMADHWPQITSSAQRFAGWVSHAADRAESLVRALGGGDLAKGLERAGLLFVGAKAAGAVAPIASGAVQLGQGVVGAGRWAAGALGGAGATAGAGAAAGATAVGTHSAEWLAMQTAARGGAGALAGGGSSAAAGGAAVLGAALAGVTAAVMGAVHVVKHSQIWSFGEFIQVKLANAERAMGPFKTALSALWEKLGPLGDALVGVGRALAPLLEIAINLAPPVLFLVGVWTAMSAALPVAIEGLTWFAEVLTKIAGKATEAANGLEMLIRRGLGQLGIKGTLTGVDETENRRDYLGPLAMLQPMGVTSTGAGIGQGGSKPPPDKGKEITVVIKWDLGEGNEEAIYVRSKRDISEALRNAKGFVRGAPMPRGFG